MKRLGINIDHIATMRNARGENHPNILNAARYIMKLGANSITIHLREDRRHINDNDLITLGTGAVTVAGDVTATQFFGDGSNLTGIEANTIGTLTGAEPLILEGDHNLFL